MHFQICVTRFDSIKVLVSDAEITFRLTGTMLINDSFDVRETSKKALIIHDGLEYRFLL